MQSLVGGGSTVQYEGIPEAVPVAVEGLRPQCGDGDGARLAPVHAGSFEPHSHQLSGGGFDPPRADLPIASAIGGIVHAVQAGLHISDQPVQGLPALAAGGRMLFQQPAQQAFASFVTEQGLGLVDPAGCGLVPLHCAGRLPQVLADVEPVEDSRGGRKVALMDGPAPVRPIRREDL